MQRDEAREIIRANWKQFYPASKDKKGIICPTCGHGAGGDGIIENKNSSNKHSLKCFSCGFSGDILDLVAQEKNFNHNEALEYAAGFLGIEIDPYNGEKTQDNTTAYKKNDLKTDPQKELEDLTNYYKSCSNNLSDPAAISYLSARGISEATAAAFNIGFDKEADPAGKGYKEPRIICPTSKYHYIGRRIISKGDNFDKMNNKAPADIFNYELIRDTKRPIFITEGFFDALSILECNCYAIALNSANMAQKLIDRLAGEENKPAAPFIICLDNDNAGRKGVETLKKGLEAIELKYIVFNIAGEYKDANEHLIANREDFEKLLKEAEAAAMAEQDNNYMHKFLNNIQTEAYKPAATGLDFFDNLLCGGIVNKTLTILLAAPAAGKTTLCQQVAEAIAKQKRSVVYFNLEMSKDQMLAKSISSMLARKGEHKTSLDVLQGYKWTDKDKKLIEAAVSEYEEEIYPYLKYIDTEEIGSGVNSILKTLEELGEKATQKGEAAPAIVIDYLHLLTNDTEKNIDLQELIKIAVVGLKKYAIKYNTFVIAISATNRTSNKGKLTLDSARDSSNIDFTGDYAIALNYEDIDNGKMSGEDIDKLQRENPRRMILRVVKGRFIQSGKEVKVLFNTADNTFYSSDKFIPMDPTETPFNKNQIKRY